MEVVEIKSEGNRGAELEPTNQKFQVLVQILQITKVEKADLDIE